MLYSTCWRCKPTSSALTGLYDYGGCPQISNSVNILAQVLTTPHHSVIPRRYMVMRQGEGDVPGSASAMVEDGTSSSMSQSHWNDEVCEKWWKHQEETRKEQGEGEVSVSASAMVEGGTSSSISALLLLLLFSCIFSLLLVFIKAAVK